MHPASPAAASLTTIGALKQQDLDAVVAIDAELEGRARRSYIQRRLDAALRQPQQHVQLAAADAEGLAGYILARRTEGEFGRVENGLRIELVGVRPNQRGHGVGSQLMQALVDYGQRHGVAELRTAAAWNNHRMLSWLDAMGFMLAPNLVVECTVAAGYRAERDDALGLPAAPTAGYEVDYGAPEDNDYERVERARCDVRAMRPDDLPQILRIDRQITGRDRQAYIAAKLDEAMDDSAIRVSLTARREDAIVGYVMARADLGDFGRTEPVAVLDTIGVDPAFEHRGVGHALLSQLFAILGALHIDRVETVLARSDLALQGFLYSLGFAPAQRLTFLRRIP